MASAVVRSTGSQPSSTGRWRLLTLGANIASNVSKSRNRLSRALGCGLALLGHCYGQLITTVVGTDWQFPADGRRGVEAPLSRFEQLATGPDGSVYIADPGNHMVLRLMPDKTIRVVAGNGIRGFSGDDGPATGASLNRPLGVAVDSQGDIYIGDTENHRIRKVSRGVITTYAGNGNAAFAGGGGPATSASLHTPAYLALDRNGNLFFVDFMNVRIRRISTSGVITTIAGNGRITTRMGGIPVDLGDNGPALMATFDNPGQIAVTDARRRDCRRRQQQPAAQDQRGNDQNHRRTGSSGSVRRRWAGDLGFSERSGRRRAERGR